MVLVEILKALADENRLRILNLLRKGELCVCEIEAILEITQSNASRHLNKLKNAGIITYEKKSQWVYYKINETLVKDNALLFDYLNNYMDNNSKFQKDLQRLKEYKNNRITCA
ncbi:MAG: metalloregulator ArsR/SmtB family transcription factor [Thermosediminibacteraceae bacterium]|nr:metalloregulator ArsR/SmtB family transcription factor [Thermosediminibacteraceae bacterium]